MGLSTTFKLIGTIMSDGSVDPRRYTVTFTENEELVKQLVTEFQNIGGIEVIWRTEKQTNSFRARAYSKALIEYLFRFSSSYRTRPCNKKPSCTDRKTCDRCEPSAGLPPAKIPRGCQDNKEFARAFLQAYITCDGGPELTVYSRRNGVLQLSIAIKVGCGNVAIRKQLTALLLKFGIIPVQRSDGLSIKKLDDIKKFEKEIGFLEKSKVKKSKLFSGFDKADVVKTIYLCGMLTSKGQWINSNFKDRRDMEDFLVKCCKMITEKKKNELMQVVKERTGISLSPVESGPVSLV